MNYTEHKDNDGKNVLDGSYEEEFQFDAKTWIAARKKTHGCADDSVQLCKLLQSKVRKWSQVEKKEKHFAKFMMKGITRKSNNLLGDLKNIGMFTCLECITLYITCFVIIHLTNLSFFPKKTDFEMLID